MPDVSIDPLLKELDDLAIAAGFRYQGIPDEDVATPAGASVWVSEYAILALTRVPKPDPESLEQTFLETSAWLSEALKVQEKEGRLFDGYLLLAVPARPEGELLAEARRIERNTSVCRKHVLWPDENASWSDSLCAVTTLGLPSSTPVTASFDEPALPAAAIRALQERDSEASLEDIAATIEDLPEEENP